MQYTSDVANKYALYRGPRQDVILALIDGAKLSAKSLVLEVGCGTGNFCIGLAEQTGCHCEGLDPAEDMLAQAQARAPLMSFVQGYAGALPYSDARFNLVFSVDVIHHVTGHTEYIQEAMRVLQSGGLLCTVTESHEAIRLRSILSVYFPETVARQIQRYPSIEYLVTLMTQVGFTDIINNQLLTPYQVTDIAAYRNKAFSCLHGISEEAYQRGLQRLEIDLTSALPTGISGMERTSLLWGRK